MLPSGEEKEFTAADKKAVEDQMLAQAKRTMKLLSVAKIADGKTVLMAVLVRYISSLIRLVLLYRYI